MLSFVDCMFNLRFESFLFSYMLQIASQVRTVAIMRISEIKFGGGSSDVRETSDSNDSR